jgi:hypothetical protein
MKKSKPVMHRVLGFLFEIKLEKNPTISEGRKIKGGAM